MTKVIASLSATLVVVLAVATIGSRAHAAVIAPEGLRLAAHETAAVEKVQFVYRGRRYGAAFAGAAASAGVVLSAGVAGTDQATGRAFVRHTGRASFRR